MWPAPAAPVPLADTGTVGPEPEGDSSDATDTVPEAPEWVDLPSSDAFTEATASAVLYRYPCIKVMLAGAVSSGKTSLLTAAYERLAQGSLGEWTFCSSSTIIGFERRCWEGRTDSGGFRDSIGRTSLLSSDYLLHLELLDGAHRRTHLLLADLSGE